MTAEAATANRRVEVRVRREIRLHSPCKDMPRARRDQAIPESLTILPGPGEDPLILQCLIEIRNQVIRVFKTNRQADKVLRRCRVRTLA